MNLFPYMSDFASATLIFRAQVAGFTNSVGGFRAMLHVDVSDQQEHAGGMCAERIWGRRSMLGADGARGRMKRRRKRQRGRRADEGADAEEEEEEEEEQEEEQEDEMEEEEAVAAPAQAGREEVSTESWDWLWRLPHRSPYQIRKQWVERGIFQEGKWNAYEDPAFVGPRGGRQYSQGGRVASGRSNGEATTGRWRSRKRPVDW